MGRRHLEPVQTVLTVKEVRKRNQAMKQELWGRAAQSVKGEGGVGEGEGTKANLAAARSAYNHSYPKPEKACARLRRKKDSVSRERTNHNKGGII